MNRRAGWLFMVVIFLGAGFTLSIDEAHAAKHGFGFQMSNFEPDDASTETIFDIDSGPIPQLYYRFASGVHSVRAGFGGESWERRDAAVASNIDFGTIFGTYQLVTSDDFEDVAILTEIDMGGLYLTAGISFQFGDRQSPRTGAPGHGTHVSA